MPNKITKATIKRVASQCGISIGGSEFSKSPTVEQLEKFAKAFSRNEHVELMLKELKDIVDWTLVEKSTFASART